MNSTRARGLTRIRQATTALATLGVVVTGGAMALAHDDVQEAATTTTYAESPTDSADVTTGSTTTDPGSSSDGSSSSGSDAGTSLGTGSGPSSARSAGS